MLGTAARIALVPLIGALIGCGLSAGPELRMVGDPRTSANAAIDDFPYDSPLTEGSIMLCLSQPATATIVSVALNNPNGQPTGDILVTGFAVRPNPFFTGHQFVGDARQLLATVGGGFDPSAAQEVSGVCPADIRTASDDVQSMTSELAVEVTWSSGDYAGGRDLAVTYDIGGTRRTAMVPFGIWLCAAKCPDGLGLDQT